MHQRQPSSSVPSKMRRTSSSSSNVVKNRESSSSDSIGSSNESLQELRSHPDSASSGSKSSSYRSSTTSRSSSSSVVHHSDSMNFINSSCGRSDGGTSQPQSRITLTASNLNAHNEQMVAEDEMGKSQASTITTKPKRTSSVVTGPTTTTGSSSNSSSGRNSRSSSSIQQQQHSNVNTARHVYHTIPLELSSRNLLVHLYNTQNEEEKELMRQHFIDSQYVVAIGDLHGHLDALKLLMVKLEETVGSVDLYHKYHLVFLGDYIDRGPKIKETIEYLIQLKANRKPGTTHCLMGNHDLGLAMFLGLFDDQVKKGESLGSTCKGYLKNYELWNGDGAQHMHLQGRRWGPGFTYSSFNTFYSYCREGKKDNDVIGDRALLLKCMPQSHKQFFKEMPWMLYNEKNIFVHGGFQSSTPLKEQVLSLMRRDIMIPRMKPLSERNCTSMEGHEDTTRRIVSGHTQVRRVKVSAKRALVDVSGGLTGELAGLILHPSSCKVVTTQPPVSQDDEEEEFHRLLNSD